MNYSIQRILVGLLFLLPFLEGGAQIANNLSSRKGKDRAIFFAVDNYSHLPDLRNPIKNARSIAEVLSRKYGFDTIMVENPTLKMIEAKIMELKRNYLNNTDGLYAREGQLLIYFSGHGMIVDENGYFMPTDGNPDSPNSSAFAYTTWRNTISALKCNHILVSIDACQSVSFSPLFDTRGGGRPNDTLTAEQKMVGNHDSTISRIFFTSDAKGEPTPDNSPYAQFFLKGLEGNLEPYYSYSSLLAGHLRKVIPLVKDGTFQGHLGGDFFFFQDVKVDKLADQKAWAYADSLKTKASYQNYINNFPTGKFVALANKKITEIKIQELDAEAYAEAERINTYTSYTDYLNNYPNGIFRELAEHNRSRMVPDSPVDDMVPIRPGSFRMGNLDPLRDRTSGVERSLDSFFICKYEITVHQFEQFIKEATAYTTDAQKNNGSYIWNGQEWVKKAGINWKHDPAGVLRKPDDYNHPVVHISRNDANAYCDWLSGKTGKKYRLPTEAEWEYAARGANPYGGSDKVEDMAWFNPNSGGTTHPVGKKRANGLGLHDMSGNVWEWCQDEFDKNYATNSTKPQVSGKGVKLVTRGGGWNSAKNEITEIYRSSQSLQTCAGDLGFRVVMEK